MIEDLWLWGFSVSLIGAFILGVFAWLEGENWEGDDE